MQPSYSSPEVKSQPLPKDLSLNVQPYRSWLGVVVVFETIVLLSLCIVAWLATSLLGNDSATGQFRGFRFLPWLPMLGSALSLAGLGTSVLLWRRITKAFEGEGRGTALASIGSKESILLTTVAVLLVGAWSWQLGVWYRAGWYPSIPPQVFSRLDWRYLRAVDQRLVAVKREAREGRRFSTDGIQLLSKSNAAKASSISQELTPPGLVIDEVRSYVVDWGQESFSQATSSAQRDETLELLALQIAPAMLNLRRGEELIQNEKLRLLQGFMQTRKRQDEAKSRYDELSKQWGEAKEKAEKDSLANQVVASEEELNASIAASQRTVGRLNWISRFETQRDGLNGAIPWLSLPIVARGGSLLCNLVWPAAIYLQIRLICALRYLLVGAQRSSELDNRRDFRVLKETWWFIVSPIFWGLMLWGLVV
jgi:hypothetical protein